MSQIEKGSILSVILKKAGPILPVMWKNNFDCFDYFSTKISIFESHSIKWVRFIESYSKKKVRFFWVILRKRFNSLNHTQKEVQFFRVMFRKSSILCVIFKKIVQFFASYSKKKGSILWVVFKKSSTLWVIQRVQHFVFLTFFQKHSLSQIQKKVQFFESYSKKKGQPIESNQKKHRHTQFFESNWRKKRGSILWVILEHKKSWTLGVILWKDFNSLSHIEKRFKKKLNSMSHLQRVQFCESFF